MTHNLRFPLTNRQRALIEAEEKSQRAVREAEEKLLEAEEKKQREESLAELRALVNMPERKDMCDSIEIAVVVDKEAIVDMRRSLRLDRSGLSEWRLDLEEHVQVKPSLKLVEKYEIEVEKLRQLRSMLCEADVAKLMATE